MPELNHAHGAGGPPQPQPLVSGPGSARPASWEELWLDVVPVWKLASPLIQGGPPLQAHTVHETSGPGDRFPSARAGQSPPLTLGVPGRLIWEPHHPVTGPVLLDFSSQTLHLIGSGGLGGLGYSGHGVQVISIDTQVTWHQVMVRTTRPTVGKGLGAAGRVSER